MLDLELLESFSTLARSENSTDSLGTAFGSHIKQLGFDEFAAVSLCHELGYVPGSAVWIMHYRKDWTDAYFHNDYYKVDPIFHAARRERLPFVWREYLKDRRLEKAQERMLGEARELGHLYGMTVPIYVADGLPGCVSLCSERPFDAGAAYTAHLLAIHLFDAARRINAIGAEPVEQPSSPHLSPRETECLTWTASGKTAWEISRILNIGENTVREYLQNVRRKYGVNTIAQAVARGMIDGAINL